MITVRQGVRVVFLPGLRWRVPVAAQMTLGSILNFADLHEYTVSSKDDVVQHYLIGQCNASYERDTYLEPGEEFFGTWCEVKMEPYPDSYKLKKYVY